MEVVREGLSVTFDWQYVVVATCVTWAVVVLGRRGYRLLSQPSNGPCAKGGCGNCPANATTPAAGLIQLQAPLHKPAK